ncbi:hypothetical protein AB9F35_34570, partial [Rhizobium leguminosarum]|uniref:hypothetical protein n=1 Tax=Rhizobium leguminosarum TaxID=384 RepID=UPI003F94ACF1
VRTLLNSGDSDTRVLLLESWIDDPKQKVALRPKLPALKGPKTSSSPMQPPNQFIDDGHFVSPSLQRAITVARRTVPSKTL